MRAECEDYPGKTQASFIIECYFGASATNSSRFVHRAACTVFAAERALTNCPKSETQPSNTSVFNSEAS